MLTQKTYIPFSIIDFSEFNSLSDIKQKVIMTSSVSTIGGTILEVLRNSISGTDLLNTNIGNVGTIITNIASAILRENNISEDTLSYYRFRINPQTQRVSQRKMLNEKYTGSGWDLDTIGDEMITYSFSGTTGSLMPINLSSATVEPLVKQLFSIIGASWATDYLRDNLNIPQLSFNPKLSASYIKFLLFEQFYRYNNNDLLFIWEDNAYIGKLVNYSFDVKNNEPYQITWSFEIKVYPDFRYNVYTGWLDDAEFGNIQHVFNKRFISTTGFDGLSLENATGKSGGSKNESGVQNSQDQEIINWFSGLGAYPYNKDRISFLKNQDRNFNINLNKITPKQLADWYKVNEEIDIFEDNISFNLKKPVQIIEQVTGKSGGVSESQEVETRFTENSPQNFP